MDTAQAHELPGEWPGIALARESLRWLLERCLLRCLDGDPESTRAPFRPDGCPRIGVKLGTSSKKKLRHSIPYDAEERGREVRTADAPTPDAHLL